MAALLVMPAMFDVRRSTFDLEDARGVAPVQDNPDGVFAYLNNDLYQDQVAANDASAASGQNGEISQ